jgi:hypothetical protein
MPVVSDSSSQRGNRRFPTEAQRAVGNQPVVQTAGYFTIISFSEPKTTRRSLPQLGGIDCTLI